MYTQVLKFPLVLGFRHRAIGLCDRCESLSATNASASRREEERRMQVRVVDKQSL
ncbi:MAG: hypothetical protein V7L22_11700 [Nostoc sp.]|uniref:hypothetical protein n=1 Tax=Nostoc sp. TaxID=1180 RepID=UPI002FFBD427